MGGGGRRPEPGGIARLRRFVVEHEGAVEADLQRFYGIDYRDRWRYHDGRRVLTLRRLGVLIRHLPAESAVALIHRDHEPYWSVEAHLLDELRISLTGSQRKPSKPHPQRPTGKKAQQHQPRKIADFRRRSAERQAQIDAGELD